MHGSVKMKLKERESERGLLKLTVTGRYNGGGVEGGKSSEPASEAVWT